METQTPTVEAKPLPPYAIVTGMDMPSLEKAVLEKIAQGYKVQGGIIAHPAFPPDPQRPVSYSVQLVHLNLLMHENDYAHEHALTRSNALQRELTRMFEEAERKRQEARTDIPMTQLAPANVVPMGDVPKEAGSSEEAPKGGA